MELQELELLNQLKLIAGDIEIDHISHKLISYHIRTKKADDVIVGRFTLAVNEGYGDNKKATFIPVTVFNKTVENLEEYLIKGTKVNVVGRLDINNVETEEGYKTFVSVVSNEIQLLKVAETDEKSYKKGGRK